MPLFNRTSIEQLKKDKPEKMREVAEKFAKDKAVKKVGLVKNTSVHVLAKGAMVVPKEIVNKVPKGSNPATWSPTKLHDGGMVKETKLHHLKAGSMVIPPHMVMKMAKK